MGKTKRGKGTKIMAVADGNGLPFAVCTDSASPAEVKLVNQTLEQRFIADVRSEWLEIRLMTATLLMKRCSLSSVRR